MVKKKHKKIKEKKLVKFVKRYIQIQEYHVVKHVQRFLKKKAI